MAKTIKVETQGISDDWLTANGDFDPKSRGMLKQDQLNSAMLHLAPLDTPDTDDPCPPHVQTEGDSGMFSFIGQGGTIYCSEVDQELTPRQATDLAFGKASIAPPPPMSARPEKPPVKSASPVNRVNQKRKFGWRGGIIMFLALCFLLAAVVMAFGVVSMQNRGVGGDDILAAITMCGGFGVIGVLMFALALKARRTYYVDKLGTQVNEDGSALSFVMMAHNLGNHDVDDYDDYGGDDFE